MRGRLGVKIRNGFVSNSSSSSFVIKDGDILLRKAREVIGENGFSLKSVALDFLKGMIELEKEELHYDEKDWAEKRLSQYRTLKKADESIKFVRFDSFNEDTYIFYYNDDIVIQTTRNLDTLSIVDGMDVSYHQEEEGFPYDFDPEAELDEKDVLYLDNED